MIAADRVVKTGFAQRRVFVAEFEKYRQAIARWPRLSEILAPLELREAAGAAYLLMDRYESVAPQRALEGAVDLFQVMRACGQPTSADFDSASAPEVTAGLSALAALYGARAIPALDVWRNRLAGPRRWRIGFSHGDFHARNIMIDRAGGGRLIDLDCIRLNGIQELDALYFVLEEEWARSGRYWYEQIGDYVLNEPPPQALRAFERFGIVFSADLAVLYLLDRVGQDTMNYGFQYLPGELASAIDALERSAA